MDISSILFLGSEDWLISRAYHVCWRNLQRQSIAYIFPGKLQRVTAFLTAVETHEGDESS